MKYIHIIENENSIDVTYFDGTELKQNKIGTGRKYDNFPIAAQAALMRALKITKQNAKAEQPEPAKPETPTPKYKVGDKVRVVGNTRPRHFVEIGSVEKIAWLDERTVMLHTDDTKKGWRNQYVSKSDIEPYTEPEQEPIKLYCVKDYMPGELLTKNKIYDVLGGNITLCFGADGKGVVLPKDYLVLDGYQPEPEYLNCEVICVDDGGYPECWKVGYKYRFENGSLRFPDGKKVGKFTSLEQANELIGARFMLYRGEA